MTYIPKYIIAKQNGSLEKKITIAQHMLKCCTLCPRNCGVDRLKGEKGFCHTGRNIKIASFGPHFGEETQLTGRYGSGTVFFSNCSLGCCFCQNYPISILGEGERAATGQLSAVMLQLQETGCHNINLVTPGHVIPQFLKDLGIAAKNGLTLPLVYNSSGYDCPETLRLLDGIIDIYMPDFKFWSPEIAKTLCRAPDYPDIARRAITEMHRQVGDLKTDGRGIAKSGLIVRHLILPGGLAGTQKVMAFLSRKISPHTHVNLMSQYRPEGKAREFEPINRRVTPAEYKDALKIAQSLSLKVMQ